MEFRRRTTPRQQAVSWVQIVVAYGLLEAALWTPAPQQAIWAMAAAGWVAAATLLGGRSAEQLGVGGRGPRRGWWIIAAAAGVAALILGAAVLAGTLHDLHNPKAPVWHAFIYLAWALAQQFISLSFIFVRVEDMFGSRVGAVVLTAVLFGAAHIPNEVLVPATFVLGLAITEFFRRYRNLYAATVAHAMMGLALSVAVPSALTHQMRVGIAYWY